MTAADPLEAVLAVAHAAVHDNLLADVDALSQAVEAAGWSREELGGWWILPDAPRWSLRSSDHAPSLAVLLDAEETWPVAAVARDLAVRLDGDPDLRRQGSAPDMPDWSRDDPRWATWEGLADWMAWHGGPAVLSLDVRPPRQHGRGLFPALLHVQIERADTAADGPPADGERDRRVARSGSIDARWHLAGDLEASDVVVALLERDEDPAVVAAVRAAAPLRARARRHRDDPPPHSPGS